MKFSLVLFKSSHELRGTLPHRMPACNPNSHLPRRAFLGNEHHKESPNILNCRSVGPRCNAPSRQASSACNEQVQYKMSTFKIPRVPVRKGICQVVKVVIIVFFSQCLFPHVLQSSRVRTRGLLSPPKSCANK